MSTAEFGRWDVIENEGDTIFAAFVHDAMIFLIVNFIRLPDLQAVWPAIDHESHARIGLDWHVYPVAHMK